MKNKRVVKIRTISNYIFYIMEQKDEIRNFSITMCILQKEEQDLKSSFSLTKNKDLNDIFLTGHKGNLQHNTV